MKETLASLELSKLAKEKGFDWECNKLWKDGYLGNPMKKWKPDLPEYPAPTLSLLQKWVREVHKVHVAIDWGGSEPDELSDNRWCYAYGKCDNNNPDADMYTDGFNTYEEALEAGLLQYIKTIK